MHASPTLPPPTLFYGLPVTVGRTNIAPAGVEADTEHLTGETAAKMAGIIRRCSQHPLVVDAARQAVEEHVSGGDMPAGARWNDPTQLHLAVWNWVRRNVRFVQDDDVLRGVLGMPDELELLIEPPVVLSMPSPAGDCDDFVDLAGSMLVSLGIPVEIWTVKAEPERPGRWSHVYLRTMDDSRAFDASHGDYLGWEVPTHLHRKGWGRISAPAAALKGIGDSDMVLQKQNSRGAVVGVGAFDWGAFAGQALQAGTQITTLALQKPGQYVQTAGGVTSYGVPGAMPANAGGIQVAPTAGLPGVAIGSQTTNSILLLGGLLVGGIVLAKVLKG